MSRTPQQRLAEPLRRARAFVETSGTDFDRLRADVLLGDAQVEVLRAELECLQREDGSFAALPGREPDGPLGATFEALLLMGGIQVRRAASLERGVRFLASQQRPDGGWEEGAAGSECVRDGAFLVAGIVARSIYARPEVLDAAGDYLVEHFDEIGASWPRLAGLSAFFSSVDHEDADRALQWAGRALERSHRAGDWSALDAARVLLLCDASALPGSSLHPGDLVAGVLAEQADDGGWPATPGERVARTLDAMEALVRLPG